MDRSTRILLHHRAPDALDYAALATLALTLATPLLCALRRHARRRRRP